MAIPIIVDTDIGTNIDDAFALALACTSPEVDLLGVTIAQRGYPKRAVMARQLLDAYGLNHVPVGVDYVARTQASERIQFGSKWEGTTQLLASILDRHDQVVLINTGPLTNTAELLQRYPRLKERIKRVVFMGGWSALALPEHNVRKDPVAVDTVFRSGVPLTGIGCEVTLGCQLVQPHLQRLSAAVAPGPELIYDMYRLWCEQRADIPPVMHDPLTIAMLCQPNLIEIETVHLGVATQPGPSRGTVFRHATGHSVDLVTSVDRSRYLDMLISRVTASGVPLPFGILDPSRFRIDLNAAYSLEHYPGWSLSHVAKRSHTLVLITDGACSVQLGDDSPIVADAGSIVAIGPGQTATLHVARGMKAYWFYFDILEHVAALELRRISSFPWSELVVRAKPAELASYGEQVVRHWMDPSPEGKLLSVAKLTEFVGAVLRWCQRQDSESSPVQVALLRAKRYIELNVHRSISLDDLSAQAMLSKYYLVRSFGASFGVSPMQYHRQLRIEQAKRLLALGHLSVFEIARQLGYESSSSFSRAFKCEVGLTPSEYGRSMATG